LIGRVSSFNVLITVAVLRQGRRRESTRDWHWMATGWR